MPVLNAQPMVALAAGGVLLASVAWWAFSSPEIVDPGRPSWKGADISNLVASVPKIDVFTSFYVNDDNPFVPYNLRLAERGMLNPSRKPVKPEPTIPVTIAKIKPPRPPVDVVEQPRAKLVLPKLSPAPADAPVVFGFVGAGNDQALLVRMPDAEVSIRMAPGEKAAEWTLVAIDNNNLATFLDPRGVEHRYTIGEGDLAVMPTDAPAEGTEAPGKKPAKATDKKMEPGGPENGMPRIPRPLPLPERPPTPPKEKPKETPKEPSKK